MWNRDLVKENVAVQTVELLNRNMFPMLASFRLFWKRILVLPAASRPSIKMRISLLPKIFDSNFPISMLSISPLYFADILLAVKIETSNYSLRISITNKYLIWAEIIHDILHSRQLNGLRTVVIDSSKIVTILRQVRA